MTPEPPKKERHIHELYEADHTGARKYTMENVTKSRAAGAHEYIWQDWKQQPKHPNADKDACEHVTAPDMLELAFKIIKLETYGAPTLVTFDFGDDALGTTLMNQCGARANTVQRWLA